MALRGPKNSRSRISLRLRRGFAPTNSSLLQALIFLNNNEQARNDFELGYRNLRALFETLQPDEFLRPHLKEYPWLTKLFILYLKKFFPEQKIEIDELDGAKTRELIREHVDVAELEKSFPTYVFDANFLTSVKGETPDAKALDIEAMLAAELKIRIEEDEDYRPLSKRLKEIIAQKRAGALAGVALLKELEKLTAQTLELVAESQRPVAGSIARLIKERVEAISEQRAVEVTKAILVKAEQLCFPEWYKQTHMDTELYREITLLLALQYPDLHLHGTGKDFVDRTVKLLKKVRFNG